MASSLKVHNSLEPGQPVPFVPHEHGRVSWYACGPTVYDHSHLGHARNYVSTDIIRRILRDYFGFRVNFVMNITDIDDKIIGKARTLKLLEVEKAKGHSKEQLQDLASWAFDAYATANLPTLKADDADGQSLTWENYVAKRDAAYGRVLAGGVLSGEGKPGDDEAKVKMHISNMDAASRAMQEQDIFGKADDVLMPYLDSLYKDTIDAKDHTIFTRVTQHWEQQFVQDMTALNVLPPDITTRVTEYVPQIVVFVQRLVDKGFAYEVNGSIYFDITAFEAAGNPYARLRPESKDDKALQDEGEGKLSKNLGTKKNPGDFALWKCSKAGEPSWPSPWGGGRPGWHIECSVMASDVLGSHMDIHSGGIDLAFPHHDNELAQSEAYFCEHGKEHHWVKYFLHMGHLSISGSKMSKSLKNFQTIKDALKKDYTPRSMRIVFLMGRWNDGVEISPDMRQMADSWETTINNFFVNVKALLIEASSQIAAGKVATTTPDDAHELKMLLHKAQEGMRTAMEDSFDTPRAMRLLMELVKDTNIHINSHPDDLDASHLREIASWITKMIGIFGLDANASPPYDGIGWVRPLPKSQEDSSTREQLVAPYKEAHRTLWDRICKENEDLRSENLTTLSKVDVSSQVQTLLSSEGADLEAIVLPYVRNISQMRDEVRKLAPSSPNKARLLQLCDTIRDVDLTNLGVYLDDRDGGRGALIKFIPTDELLAAQEAKAAAAREKAAQKEAQRVAKEQAHREKLEKAKVDPREMFKDDARYAAWDAEGLPVRLKSGEEVPKSALKKLKKEQDRQRKAHEEWKGKQQ